MRRGTFVSNLIGNGASMAVNMVVGVWFTAYLVKNLGAASYGLIPLATTMASYMSVLTLALTAAVGRSITVAHGAGNTAEVDRVFNTAFVGCLVFSLVLLPVALVVGYLTPHWLSVPAGQENEARILFIAAGLVFLLTTAATPYGVALFCRNRLDLSSLINAGMTLLRVGIVALLFAFTIPDLWQVAAGLFCAAVAGTLVSIFFSRRLMPELKFRPSGFSLGTLKGLASTGLWVSVTQFGTILMLSVDLLMVNLLLGAFAAGKYAIPLQLSTLMRQIFSTLGGLFTPTIMALHGAGERDALVAYVARAIRMVGFLAALAAGLLCGFAEPLLTVWLGSDFAYLAPLVWLMISPLAVNLSVFPMFGLALTVNKVRGPAIVTIILGVVHVGLAWLLVEKAGWGMYGVAASAILLLSLKNILYIPWYTARAVDIPFWSMIGPVIRVGFVTVAVWAVAAVVAHFVPIHGWLTFFAGGAIAGVITLIVLFFGFIETAERQDLVRAAQRAWHSFAVGRIRP